MKRDLEEIGRLTSKVLAKCGRAFAPYIEVALAILFLIYGIATYSWFGVGTILLVVGSSASVALVRLRPTASAILATASIVYLCAFQAFVHGFGVGSQVTVFVMLLMLIVCFVLAKSEANDTDGRFIRIARSYFAWLIAAVFVGAAVSLAPLVMAIGNGYADVWYLSSQTLGIALKVAGVWVVVSVAWLGGYVMRIRRERRADVARQRLTDEQLRQADVELRLTKERDRIAQDVHDIMAHSLSVIVAQSDGARLIRERDPEAVDGALQEIATSARTSLTEVRMLIESLVNSPEGHSHPTLENTGDLIDRMRIAGLDVAHDVYGEQFTLTPTQQLAVYRIVQEALTNALKHAGNDPQVRIALDWRGAGLSISISSHGHKLTDPTSTVGTDKGEESSPGRGLYGMRERARLAGGWLSAGPDETGYVVSAYIPRQHDVEVDESDDIASSDPIDEDQNDRVRTATTPTMATVVCAAGEAHDEDPSA